MFDENENVALEANENVEAETTEEIQEGIELTDTTEVEDSNEETIEETEEEQPKGRFVTDNELNDLVDRRVARKMRKLEKENANNMSTYKDTENVLKSALGASDINEANQKLREYYEEQGIKLPEPYKPGLSEHQLEVLAKDEANNFIEEGHEAMVEEANRLANIGYQNLNESERIIFNTLAEKLTEEKNKSELKSLGAKEELLSDKSFNDFRKMFNSNVPIKDIYEMYSKNKPKPKVENPGSMKNAEPNKTKDYYTEEEISKLTLEELDNPKVWEAVRKSMTMKR